MVAGLFVLGLGVLPSSGIAALSFVTSWGTQGAGPGQFHGPIDLAVSDAGEVYVADFHNSRVQKFSATGEFLLSWGQPGDLPGEFRSPSAVALNGDTSVYVIERDGQGRIQEFTPDGLFVRQWLSGLNRDVPGLAIGPSGHVFASGICEVRVFNGDGAYLNSIWDCGKEDPIVPYGLAVASDGLLLALCLQPSPAGVRVYAADLSYQGTWSVPGTTGHGIDIAGTGEIYVSTMFGYRKYSDSGQQVEEYSRQGAEPGEFASTAGLDEAPNGWLYVCDQGNHRVTVLGESPVTLEQSTWGKIKGRFQWSLGAG